MALTAADLDLIRDEIGASTPPTDGDLQAYGLAMSDRWRLVALRVLKRRRASSAGGGEASSFSLSGVLSVSSSKADLGALAAQILRLEQDETAEVTGGSASSTHLHRATARG
ncbi:MAG TPA: hypothetical protein VIM47_00855 [Dermatophilaceae bacterium]